MPSINGSAHQMVVRLGARFVVLNITASGLLKIKINISSYAIAGTTSTKSSTLRKAKSGMLITSTENWQPQMLVNNGVRTQHRLG
jgi:hypothetical protein